MKKSRALKKGSSPRASKDLAPSLRFEAVCTEPEIGAWLSVWVPHLGGADLVLLEGELGAGKSTFARILLEKLGIQRPPEGSPTFALMHEYQSARFSEIVHIDLYRIESEQELEDAGIQAVLWEREVLVLMEWAERFPALWHGRRLGKLWKVRLDFTPQSAEHRKIQIEELPVEALS